MAEYTEIFGRRIKDLTTPNSDLDKTSELVGNIKLPAGNFPAELSDCEGLRLVDLKKYLYTPVDPEIYTDIIQLNEALDQSKKFLSEKITAEEQRAILVESRLAGDLKETENIINSKINTVESNLEVKIGAVGVGNKAYKTYAEMDADKANIPAKSKVTVTNDATDSNNGDWQWDGSVFTKSAYDLLTQAKAHTDQKYGALELTKLDKETVNADDILTIYADLLGNLVAYLSKNGNFVAEDFLTKSGISLNQLSQSLSDYIKNSPLSFLISEQAIAVADSLGNIVIRLDKNGDLYLPNHPNSVQKQLKRNQRSADLSRNIALAIPDLTTDAVNRIRNLNKKAKAQSKAVATRKRVATYKDGGTTIQRIPVLFQIESNKALCMFNRGITGFDGDLRGVDTYQCFIEWNADYEITNISAPTLMYSVQNELVGGSAKHATICRLENGDLYVMFDVRIINTTGAYYKQRYLTSNDNGQTWSAAQDVVYNNHFLTPTEQETISLVMGSCGQIIKTSSGRLVTPMYTSTESVRRVCTIYSDDQGQTWTVSNNWIGGAFNIGGDGKSLGEPNIVQLNSGRLLMYMKDMGTGSGYKVKAYSDDGGETIVSTGYSQLRGIACEASITKFADDTLIATLPTALYWRTDFKAVFSFDEGETFDLIQHQELDRKDYGGYSSVISLNDEALLIAVEGISTNGLGSGESIDVYSINMKEVVENGFSN